MPGPIPPRLCVGAIFPAAMMVAHLLTTTPARAADRAEIVVADFEGDDYGGWTAEGAAFGSGPARGTLPGQMRVEGFLGRGLVNSYRGGDRATGSLTSPPFVINRPYLNFLIGGGKHPGETALQLLIDGEVVREATGPNDRPGGSERLDWATWDVAEFAGRSAVLRVVDRRGGGWGHINVDQIVQGDRRREAVPMGREITVDDRYLLLPVGHGAPLRRVRILDGDEAVREFDIRLAEDRADFRVFADLDGFRGRRLRVEATLPADAKGLERVEVSDRPPDPEGLYREPLRPQFHFTSRRGWLNDPNGLVYHEGEYHLFYQHNPYGWDWGNMHWGHAVSPDLVHWEELPEALTPRAYGDWCFSGSAVVDRENRSGFGEDGKVPLVLAYTSTGRGECIASSTDRGRTWVEYPGNPVVRHKGRDPRLLWHGPTGRWIMAVYDEEKDLRTITFYSSPDLKAWTFESRIDGYYECPDLFELPIEGKPGSSAWVLYGADGLYQLGDFDGHRFVPRTEKLRTWSGDFYAAQTFSDMPDGRRIQIGWARGITFPGMPFNQQMTVPCELTLRSTPDGPRMFARPVAELASLRGSRQDWSALALAPGGPAFETPVNDLIELRAEVEVGDSGAFTWKILGGTIVYDADARRLECGKHSAPLEPVDGLIRIEALVDRGSIEVFGNDGRAAISSGLVADEGPPTLTASARGATFRVRSLEVFSLRSSWR